MTRQPVDLPLAPLLSELHWNPALHSKVRELASGLFIDHKKELLTAAPYQYLWLVPE